MHVALFPRSRWGRIRAIVLTAILAGVAGYFVGLPLLRYATYSPAEGDIVFQSLPGGGTLVRVIEGVSESPFSHCGVVVRENGHWLVVESIGEVCKTPLFQWICRGRGNRIAVYRLKPEYREHIPRFISALEPFMGRPYDYKYRMDGDAIYCSEIIWKAWKNVTGEDLGRLVKLGNLNWKPFEKEIEEIEGGPVPLDVEMITPERLSRAPQLERVYSGGF
jgi:hypothetical protein